MSILQQTMMIFFCAFAHINALVLSFWFPRLGSRFWADWAHGPLGQYVLRQVWHTMCCISAWKLCVASALGDDGGV